MDTGVWIIVGIGGAFLAFKWMQRAGHKKRKAAYDAALAALAGSPKDTALKVAALEAGRQYFGQLRGSGPTIYDEQAINNDINARSGG